MKRLATAAALVLLTALAATAAAPAQQTPTQSCQEQRRTMGMADFRSLYAPNGRPRDAMLACLARQVQTASTEAKNAAQACRAERNELGVQAFNDKYGTNPNKRNAFGKCVSGTVTEELEEAQQETLNAARRCRAERASLGLEPFRNKYGTNPNKRNAFGKCVSKLAQGG
jgi:hypothetical protein